MLSITKTELNLLDAYKKRSIFDQINKTKLEKKLKHNQNITSFLYIPLSFSQHFLFNFGSSLDLLCPRISIFLIQVN